ncbi:apical endosomal glycoprotein [Spea bombifrons]|uniref:apical endosomal glycoprotein n=1 Tax=Spea bombifrons TaxID=233779 RepID=UPI00234A6AE9|nr:apical endosomal glycoprotein [Spea bombifrons]
MHGLRISLLLLALSCAAPPTTSAGCGSPAETLCNFICDCWDCADERHCGYHKESAVSGAPFSCDFELDDCGWKDISTSSYQWSRDRLSSKFWGSHSHGDHTLGNRWGWFMATGGHTMKSTVTAALRSPVLRDAAATCEVHLHYHSWNSDSPGNGSLSLQLTAGAQTFDLWQSPQRSSLSWQRAVVYTGRLPGEFQLTVSSTWEPNTQGNIAIDDIEFRHCALSAPQTGCHAGQVQCDRGSCVEERSVCDGTDDCGDRSDESSCEKFTFCTFENATCNWTSTWLKVNGFSSKPGRDHTTNSRSGSFLRVNDGTATLVIPGIRNQDNMACALVLYYLTAGSEENRLAIGYRNTTSSEDNVMLERVGQRAEVWLREKVTFPISQEPFQVTITGVAGKGADPGVALDDLIWSPGCVLPGSQTRDTNLEIQSFPSLAEVRSPGKAACNTIPDGYDFGGDIKGWQDVSIGVQRWSGDIKTFPEEGVSGHLGVTHAEGNLLTNAVILSPTLCSSIPSCMVNMTYSFNSGPAGSLSIHVLDSELRTHAQIWQSQGHSRSWRSALIPVGERLQPFQFVLSGSVDPLPGGMWGAVVKSMTFLECDKQASLDDIGSVTCNFETGLCGWYQDQTDDIDWEQRTLADHTTGNGKYLYVAGGSRMDRGGKARLIAYPQSIDSRSQCLSLYYRIGGPDAGTLNLFIKYDGGQETLLWTVSGTRGNMWHHESIPLSHPAENEYQLILDAVRDGSVGHISIDDITVRFSPCAASTHCSFEAGTCGFTTEGDNHWWRQQSLQAKPHGGPFFDHTLQTVTGHYIIVDTSASTLPKKKTAVLTSGWYNAQPALQCLSFWYQLGGSNSGTLNVYKVENSGKHQTKTRLLSMSGTHGDSWHYRSVKLQSDHEWLLKFEAVGAGGDRSFIAVDDVHMSHHPCDEAATCDFESGSCAWTNTRIPLMDTYDWDWTSGAALTTKNSALEKDHTLGTSEGHYVFVDTGAMHAEGSSAWMMSEHLPATASSCFTFWYRTDSPDRAHLGELVLYLASSHGLQPLWVLHGYHSGDWQQVQLQINSTAEFQIVFEASKGSHAHPTTISLDDVAYTLDLPCNAKKTEKGKSNAGEIAAIILGVLLALLCLAAAYLLYRKRKKNLNDAPRVSNHSEAIDGFDNVVFGEPADATSTS